MCVKVEPQQADLERRYTKPVLYLLTGGLEYLVEQLGGQLQSWSVRSQYGDVLIVLRVEFDGRHMVGFVGASTTAGALARLHDELRDQKTRWREDKFFAPVGQS